jgi:hypothetical protein
MHVVNCFTTQLPSNALARVVGYGPFTMCVIYKKVLSPSSGDLNRLMMMMILLTSDPLRLLLKYLKLPNGFDAVFFSTDRVIE